MQPGTNQSRKPLITGIIAVAILVIIVGAVALLNKKEDDVRTDGSTSLFETRSDEEIENQNTGTAEGASYDSGTFTASGSYSSPGGTERVEVRLTLDADVITAVEVTPKAASPTSKQYQSSFVSGIADVVVGKNIDEINVSKVSGSSLTSKGFNEAIEQIKAEASS